jgi:hypothetical protein
MKLHRCAGTRAQYTFEDGAVTLVNNAGVPNLDRYGKRYERNFRL